MRQNPPKDCRGQTKNGRELGCRNKKSRRNNTDTVGATSGQLLIDLLKGNLDLHRGAQDVRGGEGGVRGSVERADLGPKPKWIG